MLLLLLLLLLLFDLLLPFAIKLVMLVFDAMPPLTLTLTTTAAAAAEGGAAELVLPLSDVAADDVEGVGSRANKNCWLQTRHLFVIISNGRPHPPH
jgi:hypothetical protein